MGKREPGGSGGPQPGGASSQGGAGKEGDGAQVRGGGREIDQYGRGDYDPQTGLWDYYELPDHLAPGGERVEWRTLLENWALIEADLHSEFGIDFDDAALMSRRNWRWLRSKIIGLLSADTRIARKLAPPPPKTPAGRHIPRSYGRPRRR